MNLIEDVSRGVRDLDQSRRDLVRFAFVIAGALLILAALSYFLGGFPMRALSLSGIAVVIVLLSFLSPAGLKPLHTVWMAIALTMGWIVSRIRSVLRRASARASHAPAFRVGQRRCCT